MLDKNQIETKTFLSPVENKIKVQDMNNRAKFRILHLCQVFSFKDLLIVFINKAIEHKNRKVHTENNPKGKDNQYLV